MDFLGKSKKKGPLLITRQVSTSTIAKIFLERADEKFSGLSKRRDLAIYLPSQLFDVIFSSGGGKEARSSCIYPACYMAFGERFALALALALVVYLCGEL